MIQIYKKQDYEYLIEYFVAEYDTFKECFEAHIKKFKDTDFNIVKYVKFIRWYENNHLVPLDLIVVFCSNIDLKSKPEGKVLVGDFTHSKPAIITVALGTKDLFGIWEQGKNTCGYDFNFNTLIHEIIHYEQFTSDCMPHHVDLDKRLQTLKDTYEREITNERCTRVKDCGTRVPGNG